MIVEHIAPDIVILRLNRELIPAPDSEFRAERGIRAICSGVELSVFLFPIKCRTRVPAGWVGEQLLSEVSSRCQSRNIARKFLGRKKKLRNRVSENAASILIRYFVAITLATMRIVKK